MGLVSVTGTLVVREHRSNGKKTNKQAKNQLQVLRDNISNLVMDEQSMVRNI